MSGDRFKLISLFSGAGGIDLGFTLSSKFQVLLANDILSPPAQTYSCNFHHQIVDVSETASLNAGTSAYLLGDVSEIDFEVVKQDDLDVLVGGPPCQDFSVIRGPEKERQGISVKRGRLYAHFIRALAHLQPKIFVFENVPGLKSANKGAAYKTITEDFSMLNLRWGSIKKIVGNRLENGVENYLIIFSDIVNSANLGVPQKRKRLIIIGIRQDLLEHDWTALNAIKQKAESTLLSDNFIFRKYPLTPMEVFEGLPLPELNDEYKQIMENYRNVAEQVKTEKALKWEESVWKNLHFDVVKDYLMLNDITPKNDGEVDEAFEAHVRILKKLGYYKSRLEGKKFPDKSNSVPNESKDVFARLQMIPPDQNHLFVKGTQWEVEGRGISLIYRRLHPLKPSCTVVAYGGGGTWGYHYKRCRGKLTNRERGRLQTFPDDFLFKGSAVEVRAQIGEAVPPLLGERIAEVVETALNVSGRGYEKNSAFKS